MAERQKIAKIIERAAKEDWFRLNLSHCQLTNVPAEIFKLAKLTILDLGSNQLTSLTPDIGKLTNLTSLKLSNNPLTSLPPELSKLTNLESLKLRNCQLTKLPPQIPTLTNLTSLDLWGTQLRGLPASITNLINLKLLDLGYNQLTTLPVQLLKLLNLEELVLSNNLLKEIPSEISKLTNLTRLNLSVNQLTGLPPEITKLTKLTNLNIGGNQLTSLPPEITKLTNLTTLSVGFNQLNGVPAELIKLTNLISLDFSGNQFTTLPPEIAKLTNLTSLNLSGNQLTGLPSHFTKLSKLINLSLGSNLLTYFPLEISKLTRLNILGLASNLLTRLPREIGKLTELTRLVLSGNHLTEVPKEITKLANLASLHLNGNQLMSLPAGITNLTTLTRLDLIGNPLPIPPETTANPTDVKAIFAALTGLVGGEPLNEAKMLVVGDGNVGKSSVVQHLIYGTFDSKKSSTIGIEINDQMNVVKGEIEGEHDTIRLNIWDFGGQEVQHSTHLFFLTTRSLYLLVVDARKGDQVNNIEYWLKLIESFGADSPIIIVINQIDRLMGARPLNLDRHALQRKYNVRAFVETSCQTGEGISTLKSAIAREVEQLKHVHDIWPREWLAIKARLKQMRADYIPVETYLEICREEKLTDEDLQQSLLDMLHVLGTIVRFPGDIQVLDPRWVTEGVYAVLTSRQVVENQGQFNLKNMPEILAGLPTAKTHYPVHTHERLIKVMHHFELCFEFIDSPGLYLVPRHLHDNEPDVEWDDEDTLKFQYHYETLPDSVITRFIVRMNQYIIRPHYWKNGVFLESGDINKNRARVKADLVDRKIFISINGKEQTRRAFLAIIRSGFEEINANFKIDIKRMIPLPDEPKIFVSYDALLAHENKSKRTIFVSEVEKDYGVRELLDGVRELSTEEVRDGELISPRIFRIVVASPSDVQSERNVLPAVIEELNRGVAADRGLRLELSRWETDTFPGFHSQGPQGTIDEILKIADCDLLIGIFWKRFGTPTVDGQTGTEHEFNVAYQAWLDKRRPQIFVYFNLKAYAPKSKAEAEQWGEVLGFRDRFPKEGLWWPYKGKANFGEIVRIHLTNYIRTFT